MELFRISKSGYGNDLTGEGARIYGGRWNEVGTAVIYTSCNRSLAALEYLAHIAMSRARKVKLLEIIIPEGIKSEEISICDLPKNWKSIPAPGVLAKIGTDWVKSEKSLLLKVPSVLVDKEFNYLINPGHKDFNLVKVASITEFKFDDRLLN